MNPSISNERTSHNILELEVIHVHVSLINAIRRTILSDIPTVVIRTETSKLNKCTIHANTTRFHNEIVKQRLSCIPVHTNDLKFGDKYELELNVKNEKEDEMYWVTTEDFKLKDKATGLFINDKSYFPPNFQTKRYIDFLRLRPKINHMIPAEEIHLTAQFEIGRASENGMFNVVNLCTFENLKNEDKINTLWEEQHARLLADRPTITKDQLAFEERNFKILDAQRCFHTNESGECDRFLFRIQSLGVYSNRLIWEMAVQILVRKCDVFLVGLDNDIIPIIPCTETKERGYTSVTWCTMENAFDVILENEDYTFGCLLERILFTEIFSQDEKMSFVGFKKYHPHDNYSVIRVAYTEEVAPKTHLRRAATVAKERLQGLVKKQ